jgi:hypothetical protein
MECFRPLIVTGYMGCQTGRKEKMYRGYSRDPERWRRAQRNPGCFRTGMKSTKTDDPREGKQTNLAEGERDIVDQSIQAHERKGDLKTANRPEQNQNQKRG